MHISSEIVSNLPLAIAQAGAYIRHMGDDYPSLRAKLVEYKESYETHQSEILQATGGALVVEYRKSLLTTFDMSFQTVLEKNLVAAKSLLMCAPFSTSMAFN